MSQRLIIGDAVDVLGWLEPESVDVCVTSPPFLALRTYSGDPGEVGQEGSPAEYLDRLLAVTAAIGRVLKWEGSLCVELGDTFSASVTGGGDDRGDRRNVSDGNRPGGHHAGGPGWPLPKSMCLIPHLYAAALAYGSNPLTGQASPAGRWRVRNVICWARRNPTPGRVGDKLRVGTSYITVATRAALRYWDADAMAVPKAQDYDPAWRYPERRRGYQGMTGERLDVASGADVEGETVPALDWMVEPGENTWVVANGRGPRSPIAASDHNHYAVWPEEIARRLILAMSPPGGVVLDPFVGSGTTMAAAQGVGRQSIGVDIDPRMAELVRERVGMFLEVE